MTDHAGEILPPPINIMASVETNDETASKATGLLCERSVMMSPRKHLPLRAGSSCFGFDEEFSLRRVRKRHALCRFMLAALLFIASSSCYAQSLPHSQALNTAPSPLAGFLTVDEIRRIARDAGFTPLGPARRGGTMYELRAIDYRDVLMRVVIDARSGVIAAVNRVVPLGPDSIVGTLPPDAELGPKEAAPYEALPRLSSSQSARDNAPRDQAVPLDSADGPEALGGDLGIMSMPSTASRGVFAGPDSTVPPLPRPRPSALALQRAKATGKTPTATLLSPSAGSAVGWVPQIPTAPAALKPKKRSEKTAPD
jgi:hypothetical protein